MTYDELDKEWQSNSSYIQCHTSGSTGDPTDIFIPKIQMRNSAMRTVRYFGLNEHSHIYSCISPDFIGGKMVYVRSKVCGCSFESEIPSNKPLRTYSGPDIDLISVVPSQMAYILDNQLTMPHIRNFLIGGSQVPDTLRDRIVKSGISAYESYGMTETSSHIAIRKITSVPTPFVTLDGISVVDYRGVLKINIDGWKSFITNDCAELLSDREFYITGRADNVIVTGGIKINPETLELKLSGILDIPFVISSLPDDKWSEKLVLVTETSPIDIPRIKRIVEMRLHGYERPKDYYSLPKIPRTENGKFKRKEIRKFLTD